MTAPYDSTADTVAHITQVQTFMAHAIADLMQRSASHDFSKLLAPEKSMFDTYTQRLRDLTYASAQYEATRQEMLELALPAHYAANDHHPEHYPEGITAMSLLSVLEMLCDWKAATLRHADGDLANSIEQNAERFQYGDELKALLRNTARDMGWLT